MNEHILQDIPELEQDIPPAEFMVQNFWVTLAWGLGIALVLVGVALWLVLRRRTVVQPSSPRELAERALDTLADELPPLRESSLRLSMILRGFLTGQTQDPALFETHEEFSRRMDALSTVPRSCQYATRDLLERLAEQKYAGNSEHEPQKIRGLIEETRTLLADITRAQTEEAAAAAEVSKMKHKMS
jgi:hypothetical protein